MHEDRSELRQKAAMIIRLLQAEGDDFPLDRLPEGSQIALTRAMGRMQPVDKMTLDMVAEEFTAELDKIALTAPDGVGGALSLLGGRLSPAAAARLAEEAARGDPEHAWKKLCALPAEAQIQILVDEGPEVAALFLSKLAVSRAAELLGRMPGPRARLITATTALLDDMGRDTAANIAHALVADYCAPRLTAFEDGSVDRVAGMLNATNRDRREEILEGLQQDDPEFAARVRQAIFVFANIPDRVEPTDIPAIARLLSPEQLTLAIAGARTMSEDEERAADFILSNMTSRMAEQLRDEADQLGRPRQADVDEVHAMLIQAIREQAEGGAITLRSEAENTQDEAA